MSDHVGPILKLTSSGSLDTSAVITGDINVDSISIDTNGLIGKSSGGDFTTDAGGNPDEIDCTNLPTYHPTLIDDDIATIMQINTAGDVINTYSRDDARMAVVLNVITVTGAVFLTTDSFIVYTNVERENDLVNVHELDGNTINLGAGNIAAGTQRVTIATDDANLADINENTGAIGVTLDSGVSLPSATHRSPVHFTATYTSSSTITLAGLPFAIIDNSQIAYVKQILAANTSARWINGFNCTLTEAGGVITIHGAGAPFLVGDSYEMGVNSDYPAYDQTQDSMKFLEQSAAREWYVDAVNVVDGTDIGSVNDTWTDQGSEIDMRAYNKLFVYCQLTVNNSTGNQLQILSKHTSGGAEEFPMEIAASYQKTLGDADMLMVYEFDVNNGIPFVKIQTKATLIGVVEGTVILNITKSY